MPDTYYPPKFWVHAANIHTAENQVYGPFVGPPQITYEILRANEDAGPPFEIFQWFDGSPNMEPPFNDSWIDQEDQERWDGWRALERIVDYHGPRGTISHTEPHGPYWTDLMIVADREE